MDHLGFDVCLAMRISKICMLFFILFSIIHFYVDQIILVDFHLFGRRVFAHQRQLPQLGILLALDLPKAAGFFVGASDFEGLRRRMKS